MKKRVTVFGSARPEPGDEPYQDALKLGALLAQENFDVITGGYRGTMEAVSRGAAQAGAHVIGVTCEEIENWRKTKANDWVLEEWSVTSIQERMMVLMDNCDAAIALPGGVGTIAEITLLWNRMVINSIRPYPLILVGCGWKALFDTFFDHHGIYLTEMDQQLLTFVNDVEDSIIYLRQLIKTP